MTNLNQQSLEQMIIAIAKMNQPVGAKPTKLIVSASQVEMAKRILAEQSKNDWEQEVDFGDK